MKLLIRLSFVFIFLIKLSGLSAQVDTLVGWNFPNNPDNNIADVGIAANLSKTITNTATGTTVYNVTGATTFAVSNTNWANGNGIKYWEIEFSTLGYNNVTVQSKQRVSNTGPRDFKVQYRVGLTGIWTDIPGAIILDSNDWVHGVLPATTLPAETFNQPSIYLQWIMTSNISANGLAVATAGTSRIDDIYIKGLLISNAAEIISFNIPGQMSSVITTGTGTVDIVMPFGTNLTSLIPSISLSSGATISPLSGVAQDFSGSVPYVVTASDGTTTKNWAVNVTVQTGSTAAEIITFDIPTQQSSTVNSLSATVNITMPLGTDVTSLIPSIAVSAGATISPLSGIAQDFTTPVIYTVTAEDGTTIKVWTVTVTLQLSAQAEILTFDIPSQVSSTINSIAGTVDVVMPFGTDVTGLTPSITISTNATISPLSGVLQDFTLPFVYTVTAENGTTIKTWSVTITVQSGSNVAEILTFDIPLQISSNINTGLATIDLVFPTGTNVTALIPTFTVSAGASANPASLVSQDFTNPITYIVTAEDGITIKNWTALASFIDVVVPIVEWNFPNNPDDSIADGGIAANLNKLLITNSAGIVGFASTGVTTNSARNIGWVNGLDTKCWETEFTTEGYKNVTLTSVQRSSNTGPKDFKVQYKIGIGGTWTDVPGTIITTAANWTSGLLPEMTLPTETFNKTSVYLRWIMTSNIAVGGANVVAAGASNIDDIIVKGVAVTVNDAAEITTFDIPTQVSSIVNSTNSSVDIVMPYGTNLTSLIPSITYSTGATINPLSGIAQDFTLPVNYLVTAEDGITSKNWTVNVSLAAAPSNAAEIITFDIPLNVSSTVNSLNSTVDILMPLGTDVTTLVPTITISAGATISPLSGIAQDFTNPVIYIVTAEDGITTKTWTVTVTLVVAPVSIVEWNFPNNPDDVIADGGITANLTKTISTNSTGALNYSVAGATTFSISNTGWDSGMDTKYFEIEFITTGYTDITLASKSRSSATGPKDFKVQYKIGLTGTWTDVPGGTIITASNWTTGALPEMTLPTATFDNASVYLRWIMTSDISVGGATVASTGSSRMDDIIVKGLLITNYNNLMSDKTFNFTIFPNPTLDKVVINITNKISSLVNIEILSLEGRILYQNQIINCKNSSLEISTKDFSSGVYFIKASSDQKINVLKLIKQ